MRLLLVFQGGNLPNLLEKSWKSIIQRNRPGAPWKSYALSDSGRSLLRPRVKRQRHGARGRRGLRSPELKRNRCCWERWQDTLVPAGCVRFQKTAKKPVGLYNKDPYKLEKNVYIQIIYIYKYLETIEHSWPKKHQTTFDYDFKSLLGLEIHLNL